MKQKRKLSKHRNFQEIVIDYIAKHRGKAEAELRWFAIQPTLEGAISMAAKAIKPNGKRFGHQRRIPGAALRQSERALLEIVPAIRASQTFERLHCAISRQIANIKGIGDLTVYDTALRIGAKLRLEPKVVFLHAGTRMGAKAIGLDWHKEFISKDSLPKEFQQLAAREIEDVLCIYMERLQGKSISSVAGCGLDAMNC